MLDIIWVVLLIAGIIAGIAGGRIDEIGKVIITSAGEAVEFCIGILGAVALWCGLMNILNESGFINFLAVLLRPVIRRMFPETEFNKDAERFIITNIAANFMGLGNGATPSGIMAVSALQDCAVGDKTCATKSVCLFLVINSAAFQLVPTTIIAMRAQAGSVSPAAVMIPIWIVSAISLAVGILSFLGLYHIRGKLKRRN